MGQWVKPLKSLFGNKEGWFWKDVAIISFKEEELWIDLGDSFLESAFWRSLGKELGWLNNPEPTLPGGWKWYWHRFIDHLAEGKTAQNFFSSLT